MSVFEIGKGVDFRPQITKEDASFIRECLEWNKQSYSERAKIYFSDEGYRESVYLPTIARMERCMDLMREIARKHP